MDNKTLIETLIVCDKLPDFVDYNLDIIYKSKINIKDILMYFLNKEYLGFSEFVDIVGELFYHMNNEDDRKKAIKDTIELINVYEKYFSDSQLYGLIFLLRKTYKIESYSNYKEFEQVLKTSKIVYLKDSQEIKLEGHKFTCYWLYNKNEPCFKLKANNGNDIDLEYSELGSLEILKDKIKIHGVFEVMENCERAEKMILRALSNKDLELLILYDCKNKPYSVRNVLRMMHD